jgi:hypothetical protein
MRSNVVPEILVWIGAYRSDSVSYEPPMVMGKAVKEFYWMGGIFGRYPYQNRTILVGMYNTKRHQPRDVLRSDQVIEGILYIITIVIRVISNHSTPEPPPEKHRHRMQIQMTMKVVEDWEGGRSPRILRRNRDITPSLSNSLDGHPKSV